VRLLRAAGWQVVQAGPDRSVAQVWEQLGAPLGSGWTGAGVPA
jgi:hypothetical protein